MRVPLHHADREVCIIGLGYVGLTLAVAMAEAGFVVHGVERSQQVLDCLAEGRAHFMETALDGRLKSQIERGAFHFYGALDDVPRVTVYIITVGTPLASGAKVTNLQPIMAVTESIGERLEPGDMVVLRSTVRVGVTRDVVKKALDSRGIRYDIAFCPERTLEGKALLELRTLPQVIGGVDEHAVIRASTMFSFLTPTIVRVSSLEAAEMVKLVNNTQRDLMFAFANEVAEFCDVLGISAAEVIESGNIGYPRGSMPRSGPVGGPCLEKDPYILAESVEAKNGEARIALLGRTLNETLPKRTAALLGRIGRERPEGAFTKIVILGLAFKGRPETSDLRGSMAIPLIAELRREFPDAEVAGFDPALSSEEVRTLEIDARETIEEAFEGADLIFFQNNNQRFEQLPLAALSERMAANGLIYDYWYQFNPDELALRSDVQYGGLGILNNYASPVAGSGSKARAALA